MMDALDFAALSPLEATIAQARNADALVALAPELRREAGGEAFAAAVANYAQHFSPLLVRQVLSASEKDEVIFALVANPHFGGAMVSWLLAHYARASVRLDRCLSRQILSILEVAARRHALSVPTPTLELLYQGAELPRRFSAAEDSERLRETVDVLYGECLKGAPPEYQSRALLRHWGAGALQEDRGGWQVAMHPYTSAATILRLYREHPTTELLRATLRSAHMREPEVRALFWERIEGRHGGAREREWASWLVMSADRADFGQAWDVAAEEHGLLDHLVAQSHFPTQALSWLDVSRRARLLGSPQSEIRLKALLGTAPLEASALSSPPLRPEVEAPARALRVVGGR